MYDARLVLGERFNPAKANGNANPRACRDGDKQRRDYHATHVQRLFWVYCGMAFTTKDTKSTKVRIIHRGGAEGAE